MRNYLRQIIKLIVPEFFIRLFLNMIIKTRYKHKKVILSWNAIVNLSTEFEGYNKIDKKVNLANSFVGLGTYIAPRSVLPSTIIGRFCSIAPNVEIITGGHPASFVSTHPAFFSTNKQAGFSFVHHTLFEENRYVDKEKKISVKIGNDVWIGYGAKILEGILIGDGAIIAAGALITKDVPPYAIYGGVPAKLIKFRFPKDQIDSLLNIKWWEFSIEQLDLYKSLFSDISLFIESFGRKSPGNLQSEQPAS